MKKRTIVLIAGALLAAGGAAAIAGVGEKRGRFGHGRCFDPVAAAFPQSGDDRGLCPHRRERLAIRESDHPADASSTIRLRMRIRCGVVEPRAQRTSSSLSSGATTTAPPRLM